MPLALVGEGHRMAETIWARLEECVAHLLEPFRASDIVGWFRRHYPDVKKQSLRAHIQGAASNASIESRGICANREPLITRIEHGVHGRYVGDPGSLQPQSDADRGKVMIQRTQEMDIENAYDVDGIDLVHRTALDVRRALRPVEASDMLVTKVMLGVFGCVPAFDTYFKKGFGVSTFSKGSLLATGASAASLESSRGGAARGVSRTADDAR